MPGGPPTTLAYSGTNSFLGHVAEKEAGVTPMTRLQLILEKKGDDRSFDELLVVRVQTSQIPCLKGAMGALRPAQVEELCRSMTLEYYPAESIVFRQGDEGDKFYGKCCLAIYLYYHHYQNYRYCCVNVTLSV
jgi:hypothetical protein